MNANAIEKREVEVGQRRPRLLVPDVAAALQAGRSAAGNQDRKVLVTVQAGIAHAAAVQIDRVIEERAVTVGSRPHLLEEIRKQRDMEAVDLGNLRDLFRIVAMMARWMVRIGHADLRIGTI